MQKSRTINEIFSAKAAIEGAGVHLHRGFGNPDIPKFDPFLLFDDFSSENPADYLPGFPMHPHRGIETVTYVIEGEVWHQDSIGNRGAIQSGDIQWMTAGSGIMHQEMPKGSKGLKGFQLWVNLPSKHKMSDPRYRGILSKEIPEVALGKSGRIKIIAGEFGATKATLGDIYADPIYMDIKIDRADRLELPLPVDYNVFIYVFDNSLMVDNQIVKSGSVALFNQDGNSIEFIVNSSGVRFLIAAGKPIGEPIAWYGPIVMNTEDELYTAVTDLKTGRFVRV